MIELNKIAQDISLGTGNINTFATAALGQRCGGVLNYTNSVANNYLENNFIKNFNGGKIRRYKDSDIIPTESYAINKEGFIMPAPHGKGDMVGATYLLPSLDNPMNSGLKFITNGNFLLLESQIRNINIKRNNRSNYEDRTSQSYLSEIGFDNEKTYLPNSRIGDYYDNDDFQETFIKRGLMTIGLMAEDFLSKQTEKINGTPSYESEIGEELYRFFQPSSDFEYYRGGITDKVSERKKYSKKNIHFIANKIREGENNANTAVTNKPLRYYINQNPYITKKFQPESKYWDITINDLFSNGVDTETVRLNKYLSQTGLLEFYQTDIAQALTRQNFWSYKMPYGVDSSEQRYYNINEPNDFSGNAIIGGGFTSGQQSKYHAQNGVRSYYYFEESENDTVPESLETSVADGNVVLLSDYERVSGVDENGDITGYTECSILLNKTNTLFKSNKIKSLVNRFHSDSKGTYSELESAYHPVFGISRGRNLLKKEYEDKQSGDMSSGYDNPYCRTWTAHHQYAKLKDRIRPFVNEEGQPKTIAETQSNYGMLRPNNGAQRLSEHSVLGADGFVRMSPTNNGGAYTNKQKYMFSIENLAWRDVTSEKNSTALSKEQRGPNGGRIMWFPPYNLRFSENINVNWNANTFIGRGEELYTYTNTMRTGTLDFTLLIDHPSILNKWRGTGEVSAEEKEAADRDILRYFAGCGNLNDLVDPSNPPKDSGESDEKIDPKPTSGVKKIAYVIFFPDRFSGHDFAKSGNIDGGIDVLKAYQEESSTTTDNDFLLKMSGVENWTSESFMPTEKDKNRIRNTLFAGDKDIEIRFLDELLELKGSFNEGKLFGIDENCDILSVEVRGFATVYENDDALKAMLAIRRRDFLEDTLQYFSDKLNSNEVNYVRDGSGLIHVSDIDRSENPNKKDAQIARAASAIFNIGWRNGATAVNEPTIEDAEFTVNGGGDERKDMWERFKERVPRALKWSAMGSVFGPKGMVGGAILGGLYSAHKEKIEETINSVVEEVENRAEDIQNTRENIITQVETIETIEGEYTEDNEYLYFSELKGDSLIYKKIVDKVKYFDPGFHSITPEGFNARLTFLHQCTRQGPTNAVSSGRLTGDKKDGKGNIITYGSEDYLKFAGNLAFGRAPYCILRIGDFFHTKICIDSISIQYDNSGVQWDLNPEGVGVQPMYANVSISFKFLGGQDLSGPIERLQNAVTSNYYANASVYSRHADNENTYYDALEDGYKSRTK